MSAKWIVGIICLVVYITCSFLWTAIILQTRRESSFLREYGKCKEILLHDMEFELRKYKKMEEDIGVDLFTLMCALSNPVYVVCPNIPPFTEGTVLCFDIGIDPKLQLRGEHPAFVIDFAGVGYSYYFKDYGKTWALTKEELL